MLCRDACATGCIDPVRLLAIFWLTVLYGCDGSVTVGEWQSPDGLRASAQEIQPYITIGDIEPDTPTDRAHKLRPLANHIASAMGWQPQRVQTRIARSVPEITAMMRNGLVDIYIDSSYPVLLSVRDGGAEVLLESPVDGSRSYRSVIIGRVDGEIHQISDLRGKVIGLQALYSTSGYLLPAALLIDSGFNLAYSPGRSAPESGSIGFFFSGDEENSLSMLQQGVIDAGVMSSLDWARLPAEVRNEFVVIATTESVPRKMLAVAGGIDSDLIDPLRKALLDISDEQRLQMASSTDWNWEFVPLDDVSRDGMQRAQRMIEDVSRLAIQ